MKDISNDTCCKDEKKTYTLDETMNTYAKI